MKTPILAILALLALAAVATEARELKQINWGSALSYFKPTPAPTYSAYKLPQTKTLLVAIFLKCRPQINAVLNNGGVPVVDSAIANALFGSALATSDAKAKNFIGPAKALSNAVAQAVWGSATVSGFQLGRCKGSCLPLVAGC